MNIRQTILEYIANNSDRLIDLKEINILFEHIKDKRLSSKISSTLHSCTQSGHVNRYGTPGKYQYEANENTRKDGRSKKQTKESVETEKNTLLHFKDFSEEIIEEPSIYYLKNTAQADEISNDVEEYLNNGGKIIHLKPYEGTNLLKFKHDDPNIPINKRKKLPSSNNQIFNRRNLEEK